MPESPLIDIRKAPLRPVRIAVCVCTLKRPDMLAKLLAAIESQVAARRVLHLSVVVCDNDDAQSAAPIVAAAAARGRLRVNYVCEPVKNIALARNRAVMAAAGDYIAFIDDDEFAGPEWLETMLAALEAYDAAGVLGPVRPSFDEPPPQWIIDGRFCERPEYPTGTLLRWQDCRTGNVLIKRAIIAGNSAPFDAALGAGGEDQEFFRRMIALGHEFRWCNDGAVFETVPRERWTRGYMLRRALLRGQNVVTRRIGLAGLLARSLVAIPGYLMILPVAFVLGQHRFMKYSIKLFDHLGRVLAVLRVNPVQRRDALTPGT